MAAAQAYQDQIKLQGTKSTFYDRNFHPLALIFTYWVTWNSSYMCQPSSFSWNQGIFLDPGLSLLKPCENPEKTGKIGHLILLQGSEELKGYWRSSCYGQNHRRYVNRNCRRNCLYQSTMSPCHQSTYSQLWPIEYCPCCRLVTEPSQGLSAPSADSGPVGSPGALRFTWDKASPDQWVPWGLLSLEIPGWSYNFSFCAHEQQVHGDVL